MNVTQILSSNKNIPGELNKDPEKQEDINIPMFQHMLENLFAGSGDDPDERLESFEFMDSKENNLQLSHLLTRMYDSEHHRETEVKHLDNNLSLHHMLVQFEKMMMENTDHLSHLGSERKVELALDIEIPEHIQGQLLALYAEIKSTLASAVKELNINESAGTLVHLLERWFALNHSIPSNQQESIQSQLSNQLNDPELQKLWRHLVTAYERRSVFTQSGQYDSEAKVDQKDVMNWIQRTLAHENSVKGAHANMSTNPQMNIGVPMSRAEQYVIYIQQNENTQAPPVEDQLIEKFNQAIRTSRFMTMNNGPSQMLFNLKPDNLGEMMVRLTEVNGEMTAKIIVTSETTRRALQSNIHHLKNMFSPHQVVVERQEDLQSQQVQDKQEESSKREAEEESQEHGQEKNNEQHEKEESFHEILNEKV